MVPAPTSINAVASVIPSTSIEYPNVDHNDDKVRAAEVLAVLPSNQQYFWDDDPRINDAIMAVLPSCVLGNGTDSEGESDED
jgi:hypothetical protein